MSQHAGAHAGLEARARARVAENARAVRPRIARWRGQDLVAAAPPWRVSQTAAPDVVTHPGRRVSSPGRFLSRRARAFVSENWPLIVLVAVVLLVSLHTFVSLRAAAYAFGAIALVVVPLGASVALYGLVEGRWPVVVKPRRRR